MKVWVVGPIAWDTALYVPAIPSVGKFTHAKEHQERPGGQALNIACALQESGIESGLIGYVGQDVQGEDLKKYIKVNLKHSQISQLTVPTPHVVVMIDENGERTMVGMERSHFGTIHIQLDEIEADDLVVWPIWRENFESDLIAVQKIGCRTIVGLGALYSNVRSDIAIGSEWELPKEFNYSDYSSRFSRIIFTKNHDGATEYSSLGKFEIQSKAAEVIDTTGAGDAFVCGIIKALIDNQSGTEALDLASRWAAATVAEKSSIPPAFV